MAKSRYLSQPRAHHSRIFKPSRPKPIKHVDSLEELKDAYQELQKEYRDISLAGKQPGSIVGNLNLTQLDDHLASLARLQDALERFKDLISHSGELSDDMRVAAYDCLKATSELAFHLAKKTDKPVNDQIDLLEKVVHNLNEAIHAPTAARIEAMTAHNEALTQQIQQPLWRKAIYCILNFTSHMPKYFSNLGKEVGASSKDAVTAIEKLQAESKMMMRKVHPTPGEFGSTAPVVEPKKLGK